MKFKRKLLPLQTAAKDTKRGAMTDEELIFSLEEEQVSDLSHSPTFPVNPVSTLRDQLKQTGSLKLKSKSPTRPIYRSVRLSKHVLALHKFILKYLFVSRSNQ